MRFVPIEVVESSVEQASRRRSGRQAEAQAAREHQAPAPRRPQVGADRRPGLRADRRRGVLLRLQPDQHPRPQRRLRDRDDVRLLLRRQDRARPVRHPEPRVHPAGHDARQLQGRGGRSRGPHVLHQQRHRPQGHHPGGLQQRQGQQHPRCLDDHPAVRQDPLPDAGAVPQAQGQGGLPLAQDPARAEQGRDPRGLPQHDLLRPRGLRPPGSRARPTSTSRRASSTSSSAPYWPAFSTTPTTSTRTTARTPRPSCSSATST